MDQLLAAATGDPDVSVGRAIGARQRQIHDLRGRDAAAAVRAEQIGDQKALQSDMARLYREPCTIPTSPHSAEAWERRVRS